MTRSRKPETIFPIRAGKITHEQFEEAVWNATVNPFRDQANEDAGDEIATEWLTLVDESARTQQIISGLLLHIFTRQSESINILKSGFVSGLLAGYYLAHVEASDELASAIHKHRREADVKQQSSAN